LRPKARLASLTDADKADAVAWCARARRTIKEATGYEVRDPPEVPPDAPDFIYTLMVQFHVDLLCQAERASAEVIARLKRELKHCE